MKDPDFIVGDLDSITEEATQFFTGRNKTELKRIEEQDTTDLTKTLNFLKTKV